MADAVTTSVIQSDRRIHKVLLTNVSDGTGETDVVKVDKSTLTATDGAEPSALSIIAVEYNVQGFTRVDLEWDHTVDDLILPLGPGVGCFRFADFEDLGAEEVQMRLLHAHDDPESAGGTGDITLTTVGAVAGDTYAILLTCLLQP